MSGRIKRRKLDNAEAPISAFRARQKIQTDVGITNTVNGEKSQLALTSTTTLEEEPRSTTLTSRSSSRESSAEAIAIEAPSLAFSTFVPSSSNTKALRDGSLSLRIFPGERLVILGEYEISVQKGSVAILHMTLSASIKRHRIFALSSHSLPVIRCLATDTNDAEISLHQSKSSLRAMENLSPLFGRLWNHESKMMSSETNHSNRLSDKSSFQILLSPNDTAGKPYLQPVISAPEWNALLHGITSSEKEKPSCAVICGPKSSGKSTFTKLLTNRLLSQQFTLSSKRKSGVAVLDVDPGQPEYSTPGQLTLVHVIEPNFGPPYSHPVAATKGRTVRAHTIAAITPAEDPDLYISCVLDLFSHYKSLQGSFPGCPLVINTPGWVQGTGLEILVRLIKKIRPSKVIYMSMDGPAEVVNDLREAAMKNAFYTLPSQTTTYTTRTAAHLRTMQTMSYFHIDGCALESLEWNGAPLTETPPWELKYSGERSGLYGIMCYGEQPPAELLLDSINGSIVAIVLIEDDAAISGLSEQSLGTNNKPLIIRTPASNLPYFNPSNTITLQPQHSTCIGVALIRGIDIGRQRLQILTPLSPSVIDEINDQGKKIVLVSGKLDTPGWAYTESLVRSSGKTEENADNTENDEAEALSKVPWVEKLEGSQGRGMAARVWRVRRDLGKSDGGG